MKDQILTFFETKYTSVTGSRASVQDNNGNYITEEKIGPTNVSIKERLNDGKYTRTFIKNRFESYEIIKNVRPDGITEQKRTTHFPKKRSVYIQQDKEGNNVTEVKEFNGDKSFQRENADGTGESTAVYDNGKRQRNLLRSSDGTTIIEELRMEGDEQDGYVIVQNYSHYGKDGELIGEVEGILL